MSPKHNEINQHVLIRNITPQWQNMCRKDANDRSWQDAGKQEERAVEKKWDKFDNLLLKDRQCSKYKYKMTELWPEL